MILTTTGASPTTTASPTSAPAAAMTAAEAPGAAAAKAGGQDPLAALSFTGVGTTEASLGPPAAPGLGPEPLTLDLADLRTDTLDSLATSLGIVLPDAAAAVALGVAPSLSAPSSPSSEATSFPAMSSPFAANSPAFDLALASMPPGPASQPPTSPAPDCTEAASSPLRTPSPAPMDEREEDAAADGDGEGAEDEDDESPSRLLARATLPTSDKLTSALRGSGLMDDGDDRGEGPATAAPDDASAAAAGTAATAGSEGGEAPLRPLPKHLDLKATGSLTPTMAFAELASPDSVVGLEDFFRTINSQLDAGLPDGEGARSDGGSRTPQQQLADAAAAPAGGVCGMASVLHQQLAERQLAPQLSPVEALSDVAQRHASLMRRLAAARTRLARHRLGMRLRSGKQFPCLAPAPATAATDEDAEMAALAEMRASLDPLRAASAWLLDCSKAPEAAADRDPELARFVRQTLRDLRDDPYATDCSDCDEDEGAQGAAAHYDRRHRTLRRAQAAWDGDRAALGWRWHWLQLRHEQLGRDIQRCDVAYESLRAEKEALSAASQDTSCARAAGFSRRTKRRLVSQPALRVSPPAAPLHAPAPSYRAAAAAQQAAFHPVLSLDEELPAHLRPKRVRTPRKARGRRAPIIRVKVPTVPLSAHHGRARAASHHRRSHSSQSGRRLQRTSSLPSDALGARPSSPLCGSARRAARFASVDSPLAPRRSRKALEIDSVLVDPSLASTCIEPLEFRNITTPGFRTAAEQASPAPAAAAAAQEDTSDSAFLSRHQARELAERRRVLGLADPAAAAPSKKRKAVDDIGEPHPAQPPHAHAHAQPGASSSKFRRLNLVIEEWPTRGFPLSDAECAWLVQEGLDTGALGCGDDAMGGAPKPVYKVIAPPADAATPRPPTPNPNPNSSATAQPERAAAEEPRVAPLKLVLKLQRA